MSVGMVIILATSARPTARASGGGLVRIMVGSVLLAALVGLRCAWPKVLFCAATIFAAGFNVVELLISPSFARGCASLAAFAALAANAYTMWRSSDRAQLLRLVEDLKGRAALADEERGHLLFQTAQLSEQLLRQQGVLAPSGDRRPIRPGVPPTAVEVLVVEDEDAMRQSLQRVLLHYRFRVASAGSVAEALEALRGRERSGTRFDFVILDLLLSDGSGIDVLKAVRQGAPGTDVIVTSGVADDALFERARTHGAAKILMKPYQLEELLAKLGLVVERRPPSDDAIPAVPAEEAPGDG